VKADRPRSRRFSRRIHRETNAGRERLHRILERQHYRLAWWRTAADEVNWRRFFDVSTLGGVRVERPEVFEASHSLIFRLFTEGLIDGGRIDHVDGLAQPREYCQRLRARLEELSSQRPQALRNANGHTYCVVEKILAGGEPLRRDWQVDRTTDYDFMNDVGALLHDPAGAEPLAALRAELTGVSGNCADEALAARRKILAENLSAELDRVMRALHRIAREEKTTRDLTLSHPRVLQTVTDSLRYWVTEMKVDGFRFDLATILGRESYGFDEGGCFLDGCRQAPSCQASSLSPSRGIAGLAAIRSADFRRAGRNGTTAIATRSARSGRVTRG
jgi:maltooligosyltrehalose synthase